MPNNICHFEIGCRDRAKTSDWIVGPEPVPNDTEFGWFADPEGNTIGV